jgi:hypothetical protein
MELQCNYKITAGIGLMFIFFTLILFISVFAASIASERKIIYQELLEEVDRGLIPFDHLFILNSSKRNALGWVDENIRKLYIKAATKLAFRKMQLKNSTGSYKIFYEKDVEFYRNYIGNLLTLHQASAPWIDHIYNSAIYILHLPHFNKEAVIQFNNR